MDEEELEELDEEQDDSFERGYEFGKNTYNDVKNAYEEYKNRLDELKKNAQSSDDEVEPISDNKQQQDINQPIDNSQQLDTNQTPNNNTNIDQTNNNQQPNANQLGDNNQQPNANQSIDNNQQPNTNQSVNNNPKINNANDQVMQDRINNLRNGSEAATKEAIQNGASSASNKAGYAGSAMQAASDIKDLKDDMKSDVNENGEEKTANDRINDVGDSVGGVANEVGYNVASAFVPVLKGLEPVLKPITRKIAQHDTKLGLKLIIGSLAIIPIFLLFIIIVVIIIIGGGLNSFSSNSTGGLACGYKINGGNYENLKVRLLQCGDGTRGNPIEGEELVDFEKYVLGVAYAENFSTENATKAQLIAARSYSLTRGYLMNGAFNLGITNENGQQILSIRNCTEDQVYCDPDKGCWSNSSSAGGTVHSGQQTGKSYSRPPLAQDSPLREWAKDVAGVTLNDSSGNVVYTPFMASHNSSCVHGNCMAQTEATTMSNNGLDYKQILLFEYSGAINGYTVGSNCTYISGPLLIDSANPDAENWKQCNSSWGSILLGTGGSTSVCSIGCAVTSSAIQIARSGVSTTLSSFNPGTFVSALKPGGFNSGGALTSWDFSPIAPQFKLVGTYRSRDNTGICGTKSEKVSKINSLLVGGKRFAVVGIHYQGQSGIGHWVAYNYGENDVIYDFDPAGSKKQLLFEDYPYNVNSNVCLDVILYEVES